MLDLNPEVQVAEEGRASNLKAAGTIFIGVVGAGVLGLPYAFAQAGLAVGIGFLTLVAALALYCMLLLAQCKRWDPHRNFYFWCREQLPKRNCRHWLWLPACS